MGTAIREAKPMSLQGVGGHAEQRVPQAWRFTGNERKYVAEVMDRGVLSSRHGLMNSRFEHAFAEKFGVKYAISVNSGTSTLHSAVACAGVGPGDEVIVPAFTIICSAAAIVHHNGTPVYADIDRHTFNVDVKDVERKITERTRAIMPVPISGLPCEMDPIMELARKYDLMVIEDSAQTFLGKDDKGRIAGTIGHCGSFSFEQTKHMTTGDGGMLVTNDAELARRLRQVGEHGARCVSAESSIWQGALIHDYIGWNYRLPELCAAVGLGQLERLEEFVAYRTKWALEYERVISQVPWLVPQYVPPGYKHSYYAYMFTFEGDKYGVERQDWDDALAEAKFEGGPFARILYFEPGIVNNRCYGKSGFGTPISTDANPSPTSPFAGSCPVSEEVQARSYWLHLFFPPEYLEQNVEKLAKAMKRFV